MRKKYFLWAAVVLILLGCATLIGRCFLYHTDYGSVFIVPNFAYHLPNKFMLMESYEDYISITCFVEEDINLDVVSANVIKYAVLNEYVYGLRIQPNGGMSGTADGDSGQEGYFWLNTKDKSFKVGLKYIDVDKYIKEKTGCDVIPKMSVLPGSKEYIERNLLRFPEN